MQTELQARRAAADSRSWLLVLLVATTAFSCAGSDLDAAPGLDIGGSGSNNPAGSQGGVNTGGSGGLGSRPPEQENESRYLAPVATGNYLWTANPFSGRVALIDVRTLHVALETAGHGPTSVTAVSGADGEHAALVLNERSNDATLFRLDAAGQLSKHPALPTHVDANAWAVSPRGNWAIAWTDAKLREAVDPLETFQDITLIALAPGEESATALTIGARPSAVVFSADDRHAYAVTEEGISVLELGKSARVSELVVVSPAIGGDTRSHDVSFAPDASYAVVRGEARSSIAVVALPTGEREVVELGSPVTDVDLTPDGSRALAVLGHVAQVVEIPIPVRGADAAGFARVSLAGESIGSIAVNADGTSAVVYSTALATTRVSLLDLTTLEVTTRTYDLVAPVRALFPAPDPGFAIAFQGPAPDSRKAGAFSLLSLSAQRAPRITATDALPAQVAFSLEGDAALVTVRSDASSEFGAYVLDLPSQRVDFVALASPPLAAGVMATQRRAYIAQAHPEGRITFISLDDGAVQTLSAFELAARILTD